MVRCSVPVAVNAGVDVTATELDSYPGTSTKILRAGRVAPAVIGPVQTVNIHMVRRLRHRHYLSALPDAALQRKNTASTGVTRVTGSENHDSALESAGQKVRT